MRKLLIYAAALHFAFGIAIARPAGTPGTSLSLDQQEKISQIIADKTPQLLTNVTFSVARDVICACSSDCPRKQRVEPQLHRYSYLAVEELVAIVETNSRKIITMMQRMRRQENAK